MKNYKKVGSTVINTNKSDFRKARNRRSHTRRNGTMDQRLEKLENEVIELKALIADLKNNKV